MGGAASGGANTTVAAPQAFAYGQTAPAIYATGTISFSAQLAQQAYAGATTFAAPTSFAPQYTQAMPQYTQATAQPQYTQAMAQPQYTQTMAQPQYTQTMAGLAPQVEYVTMPQAEYVYEQPMVEYISSAPAVEYIQQPQYEYIQQPQMVEYIQQPQYVSSAPQMEYIQQPRPRVSSAPMAEYIQQPRGIQEIVSGDSRKLLAMGNVVSERVISVDELYQDGRFSEAPAERAPAPMVQTYTQPAVEYVSMPQQVEYAYENVQPGVVEFIQEPQYVSGPAVEYIQQPQMMYQQPQYVSAAPAVEYIQQPQMMFQQQQYVSAPSVEYIQQPQMIEYVTGAPAVEYVTGSPSVFSAGNFQQYY